MAGHSVQTFSGFTQASPFFFQQDTQPLLYSIPSFRYIYKLFKVPFSLYFVTECFTAITVNLSQGEKEEEKKRPFFSWNLENSGCFFGVFLIES